jgi:hypothetical protein
MMDEAQVIAELGFEVEDYFGGCPECGKWDRLLNVGRDHWPVCFEHKNRWCVGSNLFSSWREETETDWERNKRLLLDCVSVEPLPCTDPTVYADADYYNAAMTKMLNQLRQRQRLVASVLGCSLKLQTGQRGSNGPCTRQVSG